MKSNSKSSFLKLAFLFISYNLYFKHTKTIHYNRRYVENFVLHVRGIKTNDKQELKLIYLIYLITVAENK